MNTETEKYLGRERAYGVARELGPLFEEVPLYIGGDNTVYINPEEGTIQKLKLVLYNKQPDSLTEGDSAEEGHMQDALSALALQDLWDRKPGNTHFLSDFEVTY